VLARVRRAYERVLEAIVAVLMLVMAAEVTLGVAFRALGRALSWYEEVSVILLAWLTYYGSALAALKSAHIGVPGVVAGWAPRWRVAAVIAAELMVLGFFAVAAWYGVIVIDVLATDRLISLPSVSVAWTQSVIPIGAALFIVAELLVLPQRLAEARGRSLPIGSDLAEKLH
jgi:TRAP-type C4-dicarboxylate transport system permease small subunit